MAYCFLALIQR
uniref:Uncharacterized protein n=1 Tax=Arundo donax TaxID=35708 RepID=A0A0A8ZF35_ARUDO